MQTQALKPQWAPQPQPTVTAPDDSAAQFASAAYVAAGVANARVASVAATVAALAPSPGAVMVGNYMLFQDADGGLKIQAPNGTVMPLMVET